MALHDAYARVTPFELAFRSRARAEALVTAVEEESASRGADPADPSAFVSMGAVAAFVRELEAPDAAPEATRRFGALVYHGVHFTRAGCPLYVLTTQAARYLVGGAPTGEPTPPASAGYLQLPQHLFWAEESEEGAPASVDGVAWTATEAGALHAMVVTGVRPDRAGVSVIPLPVAPLGDAPSWLEADVRGEGGGDFTTLMPGSELDALYAFRAAGEILKLLARFFAYADGVPEALVVGEPGPAEGEPRASELRYLRVTLHG